MRFGLEKRLHRVRVVRAHRDLRDVDIPVTHRRHAEIFFDGRLATGRKLSDRAERRRLRRLATCV
jgi:hypothetical protein